MISEKNVKQLALRLAYQVGELTSFGLCWYVANLTLLPKHHDTCFQPCLHQQYKDQQTFRNAAHLKRERPPQSTWLPQTSCHDNISDMSGASTIHGLLAATHHGTRLAIHCKRGIARQIA